MRREPRNGGDVNIRRSHTLRRAPWLPLLFVAVCAGSARGDGVVMTVDDEQGVYRVQGTFTAPVSSALAWAVLTDYDHIGAYVKSVKASAVERRGDGWLMLRQDARAGMFPLQRTVHVLL